jgi:O-antigen/teichoic acid export membrane protein
MTAVTPPDKDAAAAPDEVVPRRSVAALTLGVYSANVVVALLSFVNVLIVTKALGPSGRGSVALLTTIALLSMYAATLGIQEANVNLAGQDASLSRALATNSLLFALGLGGLATVVVGSVSLIFPAIVGHAQLQPLVLAISSIPIQLISTYLARLVHADYRFALANAAWVIAPLTSVTLNGAFYAVGAISVTTAVAAWVAGQILETIVLLAAVARRPGFGRPRARLAARTVSFGLRVHPGTVMSFGSYRLDQWLLGAIVGPPALGMYSVAVAWAEALFFLPTALMFAQRPNLVRGSREEVARGTVVAFRTAAAVTVPLVAVMLLLAPFLCVGVFGSAFRGSVVELQVLTAGAFGILALKVFGNALIARGHPTAQTVAIAVGFVSTVLLDVFLIPTHGGLGAAVASTASYSIGGLAVTFIFLRTLGGKAAQLVPRRDDFASLLARVGRV